MTDLPTFDHRPAALRPPGGRHPSSPDITPAVATGHRRTFYEFGRYLELGHPYHPPGIDHLNRLIALTLSELDDRVWASVVAMAMDTDPDYRHTLHLVPDADGRDVPALRIDDSEHDLTHMTITASRARPVLACRWAP